MCKVPSSLVMLKDFITKECLRSFKKKKIRRPRKLWRIEVEKDLCIMEIKKGRQWSETVGNGGHLEWKQCSNTDSNAWEEEEPQSALTNFKNLQSHVLLSFGFRDRSLYIYLVKCVPHWAATRFTPLWLLLTLRDLCSVPALPYQSFSRKGQWNKDAVTLQKLRNSTPPKVESYVLRDQKKRNNSRKFPKNIPAPCPLWLSSENLCNYVNNVIFVSTNT